MFFKEVIGQEAAKQRLRQEVQEGRIPHAQLFCGPSGVGKLPLAMAYARYICCPNRTDTDACGTCPSCVKWNKLVHPDVHFVFPIVKKGKKEVCDDYIADWRHLVLNSPYFSLNHWLNEMDAENGQAIIYAKESDEIVRKLSLKSSEGGLCGNSVESDSCRIEIRKTSLMTDFSISQKHIYRKIHIYCRPHYPITIRFPFRVQQNAATYNYPFIGIRA